MHCIIICVCVCGLSRMSMWVFDFALVLVCSDCSDLLWHFLSAAHLICTALNVFLNSSIQIWIQTYCSIQLNSFSIFSPLCHYTVDYFIRTMTFSVSHMTHTYRTWTYPDPHSSLVVTYVNFRDAVKTSEIFIHVSLIPCKAPAGRIHHTVKSQSNKVMNLFTFVSLIS